MSQATLHHPAIQQALGRAAVYQMLSLAFSYPAKDCLSELREFIVDVSEHSLAAEDDLIESLRQLAAALHASDATELAGEHNRLFAGEVLCSAHETEYAFDPFAKSRQLADIAGFYRAFGLEVAHDRRGLPDFIATELEFLSLLLRKQVYATLQAWDERANLAAGAVDSFLQDHLGRWTPTLCTDVAREAQDPTGFYAATADLCQRFLARELERTGARPMSVRRRSSSERDALPFSCPLVSSEP
jgi:putative dimethyl sulfoxide reductase chaperone